MKEPPDVKHIIPILKYYISPIKNPKVMLLIDPARNVDPIIQEVYNPRSYGKTMFISIV